MQISVSSGCPLENFHFTFSIYPMKSAPEHSFYPLLSISQIVNVLGREIPDSLRFLGILGRLVV